ncbi:MAG: hypothetical protein WCA83_12070 [Azonexus sp.]
MPTHTPFPALVADSNSNPCHACHDWPCQFKLTSYTELTRGTNPDFVDAVVRRTDPRP